MNKMQFKKPEISEELRKDLTYLKDTLKESTKFGLALSCPPVYFAAQSYLTEPSNSKYVKLKKSVKSGLNALLASLCVSLAVDVGFVVFDRSSNENFRSKQFSDTNITFYDVRQKVYNLDLLDRAFFPAVRQLDLNNHQTKITSTKFEGTIGQYPLSFKAEGGFKGAIDVDQIQSSDIVAGTSRITPSSNQVFVDTFLNYDLERKVKDLPKE